MESESFTQSVPPAPRTSGMAVASLVCGLSSFLLNIFTGIPAIILGIISLVQINNSRGALSGRGMAITGIVTGGLTSMLAPIGILVALLLPAVQSAREAGGGSQSMNNIKQIELGLLNHESAQGNLPAAGVDESGVGPQLSWRVHILPYIEQQSLYEQFHLDEPWDSEHNRALIPLMPEVYMNPNLPDPSDGKTVYLAVTGPGAAFQGGETGPSIRDFRDGISNTVVIVEADPDQAVIWTKPDDWEYDPQNPLRGLGKLRPSVFTVGMGDGSVQRVSNSIDPGEFSRMVTRDAGD